jgi:hypothetical protein
MTAFSRYWFTLSLGLLAPVLSCQASTFSFAVIGDLPYSVVEERVLKDVFDDIMLTKNIRFVVHTGDLKSSGEACSDTLLKHRIGLLNDSPRPLIYTPGDNEWTDCDRAGAGSFDPQERLQTLRKLAFSQRYSLGQITLPLERQSSTPDQRAYLENQRWEVNKVSFITLNVTGGNNGAPTLQPAATALARRKDYRDRMTANLAWLDAGFQQAEQRGSAALVIAMQGNLFEGNARSDGPDHYQQLRQRLAEQAVRFKKPVLLLHGDTHRFRVGRPLQDAHGKSVSNLLRVESFGSPFISNWVEVVVAPATTGVFRVQVHRVYNESM